jgi:hypothetical protein
MQDFLTYAIDAIALSSAIYFSAMFVLGLQYRQPKPIQPISDLELEAEVVQLDELKIELLFPIADTSTDAAIARLEAAVLTCEPNPLWQTLTPYELRQNCQKNGIKWRNAKGKNKHLSKREMIAALEAIPRSA